MDPENPTPESPVVAPTTATVTAPAVEAKTFTQEQVNAFVAQRLSEDRARRAPKAEPTPQPKPETKAESKSEASDEIAARIAALEEQNHRLAFNARIAKFDLPESKASKLYTLYKATKPADDAAWINETIEEFGMKQPQPVTAPTPVAAPSQPPASAPQAPSGSVNPVTHGGIVDLFNLTPAQLAQLGPPGVRAALDQIRTHHAQSSGLARLPRVPERK